MYNNNFTQIRVMGFNYKKTPVKIRSKVAIGSSQLPEALASLNSCVSQGIILCTCNRTEIYYLDCCDSPSAQVVQFLEKRSGLSYAEMEPYLYVYNGEEAVKHLFRVAAGLDSMIIGEYEIVGQIKRTLQAARDSRLIDTPLLELFQQAVKFGRKVRTKTGISRNALSVSSVAVDLALRAGRDIQGSRIVVVGAGEAGEQVVSVCKERGLFDITIASRSAKKGTDFAHRIHGRWIPMSSLGMELAKADIVICCSGAPHTVVKYQMVEGAMQLRPERPLTVIDIGVPCNVDAEIKGLRNVALHDLDEMTSTCQINREKRKSEIGDAEKLVELAVEDFLNYWNELKVKPLIAVLTGRAEAIRQSKVTSTFKKIPSLSSLERTKIEQMSKAIIQHILHKPILGLKNNSDNEDYLQIINDIFCLDGEK